MIYCINCTHPNPDTAEVCEICGASLISDYGSYASFAAAMQAKKQTVNTKNFNCFRGFVQHSAPKNMRVLLLVCFVFCCVCFGLSLILSANTNVYGLADLVFMFIISVVMYITKSRTCAVILLAYSILSSLLCIFAAGNFVCTPWIAAGVFSEILFFKLNRAYKEAIAK